MYRALEFGFKDLRPAPAARTKMNKAARHKNVSRGVPSPAVRRAGATTAAIAICQELPGCQPETAYLAILQLLLGVAVVPR